MEAKPTSDADATRRAQETKVTETSRAQPTQVQPPEIKNAHPTANPSADHDNKKLVHDIKNRLEKLRIKRKIKKLRKRGESEKTVTKYKKSKTAKHDDLVKFREEKRLAAKGGLSEEQRKEFEKKRVEYKRKNEAKKKLRAERKALRKEILSKEQRLKELEGKDQKPAKSDKIANESQALVQQKLESLVIGKNHDKHEEKSVLNARPPPCSGSVKAETKFVINPSTGERENFLLFT